jgi:hypothetical protein
MAEDSMKRTGKRSPWGLFALVMAAMLTLASCQGGGFSFFATDTPTPTLTFTPTATFTPSPTSTPTQTPSPTPAPSGVEVLDQADGSIVFIDYDNKFEITLPSDWFILPLSSEDIGEIMSQAESENPDLQQAVEAFKQLDPDVIRVIAINKDSQYIYRDFSTNISVTALKEPMLSAMPVAFVTGVLESQLEQSGATIVQVENLSITNSHGVEIGLLEFKQQAPTASGTTITAQSRVLVFQSGGALVSIQLAAPEQFAAELFPVMDEIADSIKVLE